MKNNTNKQEGLPGQNHIPLGAEKGAMEAAMSDILNDAEFKKYSKERLAEAFNDKGLGGYSLARGVINPKNITDIPIFPDTEEEYEI